MGRQILISALPTDLDHLLNEIRSHGDIGVASPERLHGQLILWNTELLSSLERSLVTPTSCPCYWGDVSVHLVIELAPSIMTSWDGKPALLQGRIYGQFEGKPIAFAKWYERIARYVRKHWRKNPTIFGGYIGPAASEWFNAGGILLPCLVPTRTSDWGKIIDRQHPAT